MGKLRIDMRVNPAFYEPINSDENLENLRHEVFDIHKNGIAPLRHIYNQMRCAELDHLVIHATDYADSTQRPIVSNEEIAELVKISNGKMIGFASVNPMNDNAEEKLEQAFSSLKLEGLYLHLGRLQLLPTDCRVEKLLRICEKMDKPVVFHAGLSWEPHAMTSYCLPLLFEPVADAHPNLRICLTQFGWPYVRETAMVMVKYQNVYTDTGALYFDNAYEFFSQMMTRDIPATWIDRSLRHRVMFASGNPRFEQIRMAESMQKLGFRESTLDLIMGENAMEFIGGKRKGSEAL